MPTVDFDEVADAEDFSPLPAGAYVCRVSGVEEKMSQAGNEMWNLKLVVEEGEYVGRYLFDNLVFVGKALPRVKLVCSRLGIDVSGQVNLLPEMLMGKRARVTVGIEPYIDEHGAQKRRNVVPFAGYEAIDGGGGGAATSQPRADEPPPVTDADIPFAWLLPFLLLGLFA